MAASSSPKRSHTRLIGALIVTVTHLFGGFLPSKTFAGKRNVVSVDGSSTLFPLTEAVSEEFQRAKRGSIRVIVGISGTGGGFKKFCRGSIDVQNASRPISEDERKKCEASKITYFELPVAYDAIVVVTHPKNDWINEITIDQLKKIWEPSAQSKILWWSDIDPKFPKKKLNLYGPGTDSGTFDYFTEAIVGKARSSRGDYSASEDDNTTVQGVIQDEGSLGYLGFAYFLANKEKLKALKIIPHGQKNGVLPSIQTIADGSYQPLSRPLFIYVNAQSVESKPWVKEFVSFYLNEASKLAIETYFTPLNEQIIQLVKQRFEKKALGTSYYDHKLSQRLNEALARETKL
ncbi:MAG: PstS family phosphate ABC transporter substrate-binding protein [Bdellovibrionaceae bacterium]|nr:PstS family phosphate ABC transporter substrate-binding protein [Pseudobdellovibrionaceae bacterium]MDW8190293.1 PstS family phosphate ABC transporter substrate-binding protein [Pseudobdellovibrionaceae bacterium]